MCFWWFNLEDLLLERLRKDTAHLNPRPPSGNVPVPVEEELPLQPPPLVRQHAVIHTPEPREQPIPIEIETERPLEQLKDIDDEVEKEIAELNLN